MSVFLFVKSDTPASKGRLFPLVVGQTFPEVSAFCCVNRFCFWLRYVHKDAWTFYSSNSFIEMEAGFIISAFFFLKDNWPACSPTCEFPFNFAYLNAQHKCQVGKYNLPSWFFEDFYRWGKTLGLCHGKASYKRKGSFLAHNGSRMFSYMCVILQVLFPALRLTSCVTLSEALHFSRPYFLLL